MPERPPNVEWVEWVEYEQLPEEIQRAGCALGVFGTSAKASRVIPNKAFQALACGTPLVTADTPAARELLVDGESALLVPAGDPEALAGAVRRLADDRGLARRIGDGRPRRLPGAGERGGPRRALARPRRAARRAMTPSRFVWLAMGAFAAGFGALAVLRHRAFGSGRFDLGNMTQAVWSTANGDLLSVTDVHGEQISRLGAHFDPILAALAPLWWLWPSPELLLVVQACAVAAGALPVFWLARAHLDSERPAAALALAYLLYPPVQWLTASDFHPVSLATARCCCSRGGSSTSGSCCPSRSSPRPRWRRRSTSGSRSPRWASGTRSGTARRERGPPIAIAAGSVALLAALVVVPHFAPAGVSAFESRYDSPSLDGRDLSYLAALFLPLGLLPLAAPLALLPALPELGLNLLSSTITQTSVKTHYAATAIPALLAATVYGVARVGERAGFVAALAALAGAIVLGPVGRVDIDCRSRTMPRPGEPWPWCPPTRRSARRTRSARTSPTGGGSSASPCSARPSGSSSTRPGSPSSTVSSRSARARRSRRCGAIRTGGSSSPRTASSSSGGVSG